MSKLAVDEIIGGLIDAYEELLIATYEKDDNPARWHILIGKITALRWVLGQGDLENIITMNMEDE